MSHRPLLNPVIVTSTKSTRILLVEDHALFREGLTQIIAKSPDFSIECATGDCQEAEEILARGKIDLVLLDLYLEADNALTRITSWRSRFPTTAIIVVSGTTNPAIARQAMSYGAVGFVSKLESSSEFLRNIRKILAGERILSKKIQWDFSPHNPSFGAELSPRETEVLREIAAGQPVRKIAENLTISAKTVERHKENIKQKLNLESAPELMREALRRFPLDH